jgi:hypothetical protein
MILGNLERVRELMDSVRAKERAPLNRVRTTHRAPIFASPSGYFLPTRAGCK